MIFCVFPFVVRFWDTRTVTSDEKYKTLKRIFWDYHVERLPLDRIIAGEFESIDAYDLNLVLNRMFERLTWYELLDVLGVEGIKRMLTEERIVRLRNEDLKGRYERIRRILHHETVPVSGWDPEYRKRIQSTLLSDRWYRA